MDKFDRRKLKTACTLYGGLRSVARNAGVSPGNLSRWFQGDPTLSDEKVAQVFNAIGLPSGKPQNQSVYFWNVSKIDFDYANAILPFCPEGTLIARAPWAKPGIENIRRTFQIGKTTPSVYLLFDGTVRAVLRLPPGLLVQKKGLGNAIHWKNGARDKSVLDIAENDALWTSGFPTIEEFDALWNGTPPSATREDVISAILEEKLTFEEAIRRIRNKPD